jgi:tetratricopeptide (TPR) repeat protein
MKRIIILAITCAAYISNVFAQNEAKLQAAFSKSYQHENSADYKSAINAVKEVYEETNYDANLRMGWLTYKAGMYTESMGYYAKSINLMPYSIEAKLGYVNPAAAAGLWEKVIDQYHKILVIDPQNTTVNYRMGLYCYNKKDYKSAYGYFEKVVNLYPFDYDSELMFAWTNFQLGKFREAKIIFNKVLLMSPGDKSALEGLSLIK